MADREGIELFLGDMAGHQAATAGQTTPGRNQALAADLFERLDQKRAEQAGKLQPKPAAEPPPVAAEPRASDLEAKRRGYRILRGGDLSPRTPVPGGDVPLIATWGPREQEYYRAVSARVRLLLDRPEPGILGAPSWRDQALAVLAVGATGQRKLAAKMMMELVKASEAAFGAVFATQGPKVFVGAGGPGR